ncbi:MAG: exopolysaccharide biosynthesis protein [Rickettsiales bacterium]
MKKPASKKREGQKISAILEGLPGQFSGAKTTIGDLKDTLSARAYGILLMVLALPNLIPIPAPGLSTILGAPLVLVTFQLVLGLESPWFPKFIARRPIKVSHIKKICARISPWIRKLERVVRPRLFFLTSFPADRLVALTCFILSLMIMMPLPFGNAVPGLAICLFAIGILQRDGVMIIAGLLVTLISATVIAAFVGGIVTSVSSLLGL